MNAVAVRDVASAEQASSLYPSHHKIESWLVLWRLGLPTLAGIIVDDWSPQVEKQVREFAASLGADSLLVRSDKAPETGDYPPAGDISPVDEMRNVAMRFLKRGRVLFLLEPRSRFDDLYSLSIGFRNSKQANVEIVGPGFDASDLKRGDASPHEWLEVSFPAPDQAPALENHTVVTPRAYRRSWEVRLAKVGRLVAGEYPASTRPPEEAARAGKLWLEQHGFRLLLDNRAKYQPIPSRLLDGSLEQCRLLPEELARFGIVDQRFVVSLSFLGRDAEPVYWDIVWPSKKFDVPARPLGTSSQVAKSPDMTSAKS
jgi:hypothetical protein